MKHHISMLITEGHLHLAPIDQNPQVILDIGTGTGEIGRFKAPLGVYADESRHLGY